MYCEVGDHAMPPKQRITKDILLESALKIAQEQGIAAVTSRSVAKCVGCSIQPVFSQFPTMDKLRQATFDYASETFVKEILSFGEQPDFFTRTTQWVIDLARNKPNLFNLIYLSDHFQGNALLDVMMSFESNEKLVSKMIELYELESDICKDILLRSCLFLMGIGTMICINRMTFSDEQVAGMMKQTVADMVQGAKRDLP